MPPEIVARLTPEQREDYIAILQTQSDLISRQITLIQLAATQPIQPRPRTVCTHRFYEPKNPHERSKS